MRQLTPPALRLFGALFALLLISPLTGCLPQQPGNGQNQGEVEPPPKIPDPCEGGSFAIDPAAPPGQGSICVCSWGKYRQTNPDGSITCGESPYQAACGGIKPRSPSDAGQRDFQRELAECYACINQKCPYTGGGEGRGTYPTGCNPNDRNNDDAVAECLDKAGAAEAP